MAMKTTSMQHHEVPLRRCCFCYLYCTIDRGRGQLKFDIPYRLFTNYKAAIVKFDGDEILILRNLSGILDLYSFNC